MTAVEDPDTWRWVWMVAAATFLIGEMAMVGTFFLMPFGIGAVAAAISAFAGAGLGLQWLFFVGVSAVAAAGLIPLGRRLDRKSPSQDGIGARRLLNQEAVVVREITSGPHGSGLVRLGREDWRAESIDGSAIGEGVVVRVVDVRGTGVVVKRLEGDPS